MRIQHNIMAMNAYRNYTNNVSAMKKNLERLSSGYKINRAGDDAAGLAISEKMRAQITGLETAQKNAKDGISLVQTAEGALTEVHDMLNRMVELATQSANGTYDNDTDRYQLQKELNQLRDEINRIADGSNFNGIKLLDGSLGLGSAFTVGDSVSYVANADGVQINLDDAKYISGIHGNNDSTKTQAPSFKVDLSSLKIKAADTSVHTYTLKIGSFATISFTFAGVAGQVYGVSNAALLGKINGKLASLTLGTNLPGAFNVGGAVFARKSALTAGGVLTFEFRGVGTNVAAASKAWGMYGSSDLAAKINAAMKGAVTLSVKTGDNKATAWDTYKICDVYAVKDAKAADAAANWGLDLDISQLVKDGYKLVIGKGSSAKTFVFKTDVNSKVTAASGQTLIDVSMFATASNAATLMVQQAARMIVGGQATATGLEGYAGGSAATAAGFKLSYLGGGKIHFDLPASLAKSMSIDSEAKLKKLFTAYEAGSVETMANTKLEIDPSKIVDGNVLTIDDKKIEFAKGDTINDVIEKIQKAGYTVEQDPDNENLLTITAKDATSKTGAPVILGKGLTLQIGDTAEDYNQLTVTVRDCHAKSLGIADISIEDQDSAANAIDAIKSAINYVSDVRGTLGATQNRLDHTINNLSVMTENIQDAESTIRDTDIAEEMMAYTKNNILIQSAQAMLAQANQVPQGVLQLLQ